MSRRGTAAGERRAKKNEARAMAEVPTPGGPSATCSSSDDSAARDWTRYRPPGHPALLAAVVALLVAWIVFLIAMTL